MSVSVHVIDNARGRPAAAVAVRLSRLLEDGAVPLGRGITDPDGRLADLAPGPLSAGVHQLVFETGAYFERLGLPLVEGCRAEVEVAEGQERYHIPLLVTPFAYTTYRGS